MPSLAASCALACFALGLGARGASAAAPAAAPPPPSALASARELASSVLSRVLPEAGDRLVLNDTQLCLNHNLVFGECGPASHWRVDKTGVRCGSKCLVRTFGGGLALDECARAAERALTLQNGRLCLGERCDRCIAAPFAAGRGARKRDRCGAIILARAPAYWALMAVLTLGAMWLVGAGVLLCLSGELRVGAPSAAALASARALLEEIRADPSARAAEAAIRSHPITAAAAAGRLHLDSFRTFVLEQHRTARLESVALGGVLGGSIAPQRAQRASRSAPPLGSGWWWGAGAAGRRAAALEQLEALAHALGLEKAQLENCARARVCVCVGVARGRARARGRCGRAARGRKAPQAPPTRLPTPCAYLPHAPTYPMPTPAAFVCAPPPALPPSPCRCAHTRRAAPRRAALHTDEPMLAAHARAAYISSLATDADAAVAAGALALAARPFGSVCAALASALRRDFGLGAEHTAFLDACADEAALAEFEARLVALVAAGLARGVPRAEIERAARMLQGYEQAFWDAIHRAVAELDEPVLRGAEGRFSLADGASLHYTDAGARDGRVLLLLHGWPDSLHGWRLLGSHLDPRLRVLSVSLRGFGDSWLNPGTAAANNSAERVGTAAANVRARARSLRAARAARAALAARARAAPSAHARRACARPTAARLRLPRALPRASRPRPPRVPRPPRAHPPSARSPPPSRSSTRRQRSLRTCAHFWRGWA